MSNSSAAANLNSIRSNLEVYFNIISSSIGIPCNLISILIFARLLKNKTNMGFLYIWQCSVDLCLLLFFLLLFRSAQTLGIGSLSGRNDSSCKFLTFLRRFILHASSWIAVVTTIDRVIFVLYGHGERFKFMKKKRYLTAIILAIFVVIAVLDIPNLFFYVKSGVCTADFIGTISSDIISICIRTYIPFTIMIVSNLLMIQKIIKNKRTVAAKSSKSKQSSTMRRENQFTIAVMSYDVYFLLFNFPVSIYYIMYDINLYSGAFTGADAVFSASYNLANGITSNLSFCVQTLSIFTYILFNKRFRRELFFLISCLFCSQSSVQVPSTIKSQASRT